MYSTLHSVIFCINLTQRKRKCSLPAKGEKRTYPSKVVNDSATVLFVANFAELRYCVLGMDRPRAKNVAREKINTK